MPERNTHAETVYEQLCENYRAIDDLRTKLLGLLPTASATGIALLLNDSIHRPAALSEKAFFAAIGVFGALVTVGLFAYELNGMTKCSALIVAAKKIESDDLGIPSGPFSTHPDRFCGFIDVPFASSVVYPATLAVWLFLALAATSRVAALISAAAMFVGVFTLSLVVIWRHRSEEESEP